MAAALIGSRFELGGFHWIILHEIGDKCLLATENAPFQGYYGKKLTAFEQSALFAHIRDKVYPQMARKGADTARMNMPSILSYGQYVQFVKGKFPAAETYLLLSPYPGEENKVYGVAPDDTLFAADVRVLTGIRLAVYIDRGYALELAGVLEEEPAEETKEPAQTIAPPPAEEHTEPETPDTTDTRDASQEEEPVTGTKPEGPVKQEPEESAEPDQTENERQTPKSEAPKQESEPVTPVAEEEEESKPEEQTPSEPQQPEEPKSVAPVQEHTPEQPAQEPRTTAFRFRVRKLPRGYREKPAGGAAATAQEPAEPTATEQEAMFVEEESLDMPPIEDLIGERIGRVQSRWNVR